MRKLILAICLVFMVSLQGCTFGDLQIKTDSEILSPLGTATTLVANYIMIKYPGEVETYKVLSDKVINADSDKLFEKYFDEWINSLTGNISDSEMKIVLQSIINSFDVQIDGDIDFDGGAIRTGKDIVKIFNAILGE